MTTSNTKLQTGSCGGSLHFATWHLSSWTVIELEHAEPAHHIWPPQSLFLPENESSVMLALESFLWFPLVSLPSLSGTGQVVIYLPAASIPSLPSCNPTRYASPQRCLQTKWFAQCVQPMLSVMLTHILIVQLELNPLAYRKNERFDK